MRMIIKKVNYKSIVREKIKIIYLLIKNLMNIIWLIVEIQKLIKLLNNNKQLDNKLAQLLLLIIIKKVFKSL